MNCARKHLAQASILMMEAKQGYPLHEWFAMGHMAEAGDELLLDFPELATEIRTHRKLYEDNRDYPVPIEELIEAITELDEGSSWSSREGMVHV